MRRFALLLCLLFAPRALAAPGQVASKVDPFYTAVATGRVTYLLCDGLFNNDGISSCQPASVIDIPAGAQCYDAVFSISKCQAGCEPGNIKIMESDSMTIGSPNLWTTVGTLTGCAEPLISSFPLKRMPKAAIRAELTALTGKPLCTDVDVTVTFFCY